MKSHLSAARSVSPCPAPVFRYQGASLTSLPGSSRPLRTTSVLSQIERSAMFVPSLSPRDTKFAVPAPPAAATSSKARAASCGAAAWMPAGSAAGPTITKSL